MLSLANFGFVFIDPRLRESNKGSSSNSYGKNRKMDIRRILKNRYKYIVSLSWLAVLLVAWLVMMIGTHRAAKHCPLFVTLDVLFGCFILGLIVIISCMWDAKDTSISYKLQVGVPPPRERDYVEMEDLQLDNVSSGSKTLYLPKSRMSRRRKACYGLLSCCFVFWNLLILTCFALYLFLVANTTPQIEGSIKLKGLQDKVEVFRDDDGMIHIDAANEHDLYFAMGIATAQERLWQMEFCRRIGSGRLSEFLGEDLLDTDKYIRTLGVYLAAQNTYDGASAHTKLVYDAYLEGVNAYLEEDLPLQLEFYLLGIDPEPYTPADLLVWGKMLSYATSLNLDDEIKRYQMLAESFTQERIDQFYPEYGLAPLNSPTIVQEEDLEDRNYTIFEGQHRFDTTKRSVISKSPQPQKRNLSKKQTLSQIAKDLGIFPTGSRNQEFSNGWVVSGERSESGKPLHCNDPHENFGAPAQWLLMHLKCPGLDAIGATIPLIPAVLTGRNPYFSWGITNAGVDNKDLFILQENSDGTGYIHNGAELSYSLRTEKIKVAGASTVEITVRNTLYGPVLTDHYEILGENEPPLAFNWTGLIPQDSTADALIDIMYCKNASEFLEVVKQSISPVIAYTFADIEGNIGFIAPGKYPVRANGHDGTMPVIGDGSMDFLAYVPFDEIPQVLNPKRGFVVTGNQQMMPDSYPHYKNRNWSSAYRPVRIEQLLMEKQKLSFADMKRIHSDYVNLLHNDTKEILSNLTPLSKRDKQWRDRLLAWNGNEKMDSTEATIFETWWIYLSYLPEFELDNITDKWAIPAYLLTAMRNNQDKACQDRKVTCLEFAAKSLKDALDLWDIKDGNSDPPSYGTMHKANFLHGILTYVPMLGCLYDRVFGYGGSANTIVNGDYSYSKDFFDDKVVKGYKGQSYKHCIDFGNVEASGVIIPPGQSGNPFLSTYDNLIDPWLEGNYLSMSLTKYKALSHKLVLAPK